MLKRFLLFILFLTVSSGYAAHLVGGEITYKCIGNNDYEVTLTIYRDCFSSGAQFDPLASVTIYDINNNLIQDLEIPILSSSQLPVEAPNNCTTLPLTVCTERAIYRFITHLPPRSGGYVITHQRCCRNATIANIGNPDDWGSTYTTTIPSHDTACNSSPHFNDTPPVVLCINQPLNLDMSATDDDGDSLYYQLCNPLHGGGNNTTSPTGVFSPKPDTAAPPPYSPVPYSPGFSSQNPITSSNPIIQIDPLTGVLSGRPTAIGQYVFAICVSEYRNGTFMGTIRRDFQFNVSSACKATISQMETQIMNPSTICNGPVVSFKNLSSYASTYFWDFGDPLISSDTSRVKDPVYTYADTGSYTVTLIANPGDACADTSYYTFKVNHPLNITHTIYGEECFDSHSLDFELHGDYSIDANIQWDFGGQTNLGFDSELPEPSAVQYVNPGRYTVKVMIEDFGCTEEIFDTVYLFNNPKLIHTVPQLAICASESVQFTDNSTADAPIYHHWDFGDGYTSNNPNPVHTYEEPGVYSIEHSIQTFTGCKDSLFERFPQRITVFTKPVSRLKVSPSVVNIFDPVITLTNQSEDYYQTRTYLPGGEIIETFNERTISLPDTGTFHLLHVAISESGCQDSSYQTIVVDVPLNIYIPNAFSPNGDGINDEFSLEATGIENYNIRIFNRWGEMVFESGDINDTWNGNIMNLAEEAPSGLYTYQVVVNTLVNARNITRYGTITLIR
ncbi:MAG: PKD domain-containing protein [Owenweeksia sp.]